MKIAIIQFPGSNAESESIRAVRTAGMEPVEFLWNQNPNDLQSFDGFFIVGGFSYEDRSRSGIIASLDPIMKYIKAENEKGKPILGICNGAQVLVETGIVPGLKDYQVGMALAVNKRVKDGHVLGTGFYNAWVNVQLSAPSNACAFSQSLKPGEFMHIPVAHGEGRFVMPPELLEELKSNNQTVFRYCDDTGNISEEFPVNPNGAMYNLAAVCNARGNAMAMMPHPERVPAGQPIFTSMRDYITERKSLTCQPNTHCHSERSPKGAVEESLSNHSLTYSPTQSLIINHQSSHTTTEWLIDLVITDNEAVTVQNALKHIGINAGIKRYTHWEIVLDDTICHPEPDSGSHTTKPDPDFRRDDILKQIMASGELFNSNKEFIADGVIPTEAKGRVEESLSPQSARDSSTPLRSAQNDNSASILTRYRDDFVGKSKTDTLRTRFGLTSIKEIKKGVLWKITTDNGNIDDVTKQILNSRILFNQYSQVGYTYADTPPSVPPLKGEGESSTSTDQLLPLLGGEHKRGYHDTMEYTDTIKQNLHNCLTETNLAVGNKRVGKVRDTYKLPDKMILITTDRQSAFDRILASVPFKGQVLNQTSAWWFDKTKHIVPNHVLSIPDPNVTVGKKCTVFPVEFVVRGYITGTTDTSAWMNYKNGVRQFCGNTLPEGLKKNQKFDYPIITPTTKSDEHDRSISPTEIVTEGLMTQTDWDYVSSKALAIFEFGQKIAAEHGLILVDTKYEFGKDADDNILLIDEIHTPDSSRYWIAKSYEDRLAKGEEPENIDKEFLRLWFKEHCDPYNDKVLPPAPDDLVIELSRRYIMLYEMITGEKFVFPDSANINERIFKNLTIMV